MFDIVLSSVSILSQGSGCNLDVHLFDWKLCEDQIIVLLLMNKCCILRHYLYLVILHFKYRYRFKPAKCF